MCAIYSLSCTLFRQSLAKCFPLQIKQPEFGYEPFALSLCFWLSIVSSMLGFIPTKCLLLLRLLFGFRQTSTFPSLVFALKFTSPSPHWPLIKIHQSFSVYDYKRHVWNFTSSTLIVPTVGVPTKNCPPSQLGIKHSIWI